MTASMFTHKMFGVSPCRNMKLYFRRAPYDDGTAIAGRSDAFSEGLQDL